MVIENPQQLKAHFSPKFEILISCLPLGPEKIDRKVSNLVPWGLGTRLQNLYASNHSRPQRLRSIWPAPWIETSVGT